MMRLENMCIVQNEEKSLEVNGIERRSDQKLRCDHVRSFHRWQTDLFPSNQLVHSSVKAKRNNESCGSNLTGDLCRTDITSNDFLIDLETIAADDLDHESEFLDDSLTISSMLFYPEKNIDEGFDTNNDQRESCGEKGEVQIVLQVGSPRSAESFPMLAPSVATGSLQRGRFENAADSIPSSTRQVQSSCPPSSSTSTQADRIEVPKKEPLADDIASNQGDKLVFYKIEYVVPNENDVLLGRGGKINHHPGNQRYLQARSDLHSKYEKASKAEKRKISDELVRQVHQWNGRFLKKVDDDSSQTKIPTKRKRRRSNLVDEGEKWYEVTSNEARKKASQGKCVPRTVSTSILRNLKRVSLFIIKRSESFI
jgi:hypothetical protein